MEMSGNLILLYAPHAHLSPPAPPTPSLWSSPPSGRCDGASWLYICRRPIHLQTGACDIGAMAETSWVHGATPPASRSGPHRVGIEMAPINCALEVGWKRAIFGKFGRWAHYGSTGAHKSTSLEGQISREISGNAFSSEGSNFQRKF